jgi:hypothetical protein
MNEQKLEGAAPIASTESARVVRCEFTQARHLKLAAMAAALIVGLGASWPSPGHAGIYYGPVKGANGQCWHSTGGSSGRGYWGDCERENLRLMKYDRGVHSDTTKGRAAHPAPTAAPSSQ